MKSHVSLFSGIGGFDLAAEWAGYETVLFVEKDDYCQKVLKRHWPNVPIIGDIRNVNEATLADAAGTRRATWASEGQFGGCCESGACGETAFPTIDLLTGGFPCQPFSVAGKRGGASDDRFLWPEMLRVIALLKPRWVLGENVAGIINMALDDVLSDLEGQGYEVGTVVLPACAVNAPHRRDRVWIVGYATGSGRSARGGNQQGRQVRDAAIGTATENQQERSGRQLWTSEGSGREDVADTDEQGPQGHRRLRERADEWFAWQGSRPLESLWESEPSVLRVANGIPRRVDRLRCLGNSIVPQVAYQIIKAIED